VSKLGFQVFDSDCHVVEPGEQLEQYIESRYLDDLRALAEPNQILYSLNRVEFRRRLGSTDDIGQMFSYSKDQPAKRAPRYRAKPRPATNVDPHARIADMDLEGIDAGVLFPSGVGTFCSVQNAELELAVYRAYHRYLNDFCQPYPGRLSATMMVSGRSISDSIQEMRRLADESWVVGVFPSLPPDMAFDDESLEPLWAEAAALEMTVTLHTFTNAPPYAPGARDGSYFDNMWLARSAAHPWCGMRNMASILGSGILGRHPELRVAIVEAGHGWLPYWVARLDEQADFMPAALPDDFTPIAELISGGRYFQAIELHEGEPITRGVIDLVGPDVLMWSSDYPHGETWFPEAVDSFLNWNGIDDLVKRKTLWDNAVRCFPRFQPPPAQAGHSEVTDLTTV
jgi:uncharacterized protein